MKGNANEGIIPDDLRHQLANLMPDLAPLYDFALEFLDRYDETRPDAQTTLALLAHCVRELLNRIPDMLDTNIASTRAVEDKALEALKKTLADSNPIIIPDDGSDVVGVSRDIVQALAKYQSSRALGTETDSSKMASVFLGDASARGGSLTVVKHAKGFFMNSVHFGSETRRILPSYVEVANEFQVIETSLRSRLGDFFAAKEHLLSFVEQMNQRADGGYLTPTNDQVKVGLSLIADPRLAILFYAKLENPFWLEGLIERHALTNLATPETTGSWPEYAYVERMAPVVPREVCQALGTASRQSPPLVRNAVLSCASRMPAEHAKELVDILIAWTDDDSPLEDDQWTEDELAGLFASVLSDGAAQKKGKQLLQKLYRPRPISKITEGSPYYGRFASCVPSYYYEASLAHALQWLPLTTRIGILRTFLHTMETTRCVGDKVLTSYFVPSIEDACHENSESIEKQLVRLLNQSLRELVSSAPRRFERYILDCNHHILQRTAMQALKEEIGKAEEERLNELVPICDAVFALPSILEGAYDPELFPLTRTIADRVPGYSFDALLECFDEQASRRLSQWIHYYSESEGLKEEDAKQEATIRTRRWQHRILSLLGRQHLDGAYLKQFDELECEFGPTHYEAKHVFTPVVSWSSASPVTLEKMRAMPPDSLLDCLQNYGCLDESPSSMFAHQNQADVLQTLVASDPNHFEGHTDRLTLLGPIYLAAVLNGWEASIRVSEDVDVPAIVEACEWIASLSDDETLHSVRSTSLLGTSYDDVQTAAARLVGTLVVKRGSDLPTITQDAALEILLTLCESSFPYEESSVGGAGSQNNPSLSAINGTRTLALIALGAWTYICGNADGNRRALEALSRNMTEHSASLCDGAALGMAIPNLVAAKSDWARARYCELFGNESPSKRQQVTLTTALAYSTYNRQLFDFLRPAMTIALREGCEDYVLGHPEVTLSCPQLIGEWVVYAILHGHIPAEGGIFAQWQSANTPERQCLALLHNCSALFGRNRLLPLPFLRAAFLWDMLDSQPLSREATDTLCKCLRYMIASGFFPSNWWAPRLARTLNKGADPVQLVYVDDELAELAKRQHEPALSVLKAAISTSRKSQPGRYQLERIAVPIIGESMLQQDEHLERKARQIMSDLGRMGLTDLDELVGDYIQKSQQ